MQVLTQAGVKLLEEAINSAETWRGSMIGNPDPEPLASFDEEIAAMRKAIAVVKEQQGILRKVRLGLRKQNTSRAYVHCEAPEYGCVDILSFELS
jgi:hypothetical protein